ncbi:MAG: VOC family protein [Solirubrobacteraceae bacterium]
MGEPVVHWQILSQDPDTLTDFYTSLFDWRSAKDPNGGYTYVHTNTNEGISGGISRYEGYGGVTFYVRVDDLDAYLVKVAELGGEVQMPPTVAGDVRLAVFADPRGNSVGLIEA